MSAPTIRGFPSKAEPNKQSTTAVVRRTGRSTKLARNMKKQHEDKIRENKYELQRRLVVEELLLSHLHEKNILSDGMFQDIDAKPSRGAKASALLSLLPKRGPDAFKEFIQALIITDQNVLADLLDPHHAIRSQNETTKIPTSTEVSNEPETQTGSGGATRKEASTPENKKEASTPENKKKPSTPERTEETERQSAATPERTETKPYFEDEKDSAMMSLSLKSPGKKYPDGSEFIKKGRVLIINNEQLTTKVSRRGALFDFVNFIQLFKKLGFDIKSEMNLTLQQMKNALEAESQRSGDCDGFVLCIMGMGGCDRVCGTDGRPMSINEIKTYFDETTCPALKGKPKIIITETCRGDKCPEEKPPSPGVDDLDNAMKDVHISTPKLAWQADGGSEVKDTMIALRCEIKGYDTARSETYGSWFIRRLVKKICDYAHEDNVFSMLNYVKNDWENRNDQNMEITLSGPRNVYFHPSTKA